MSWKIRVMYFKQSGKFYAEGEYTTDKEHMFEVFDEFRDMLAMGKRPGLADGHSGFTAILDCDAHPNGYPACFHGAA